MIGAKVDMISRSSCSVCLRSVAVTSAGLIDQTARTVMSALLAITSIACQICLDLRRQSLCCSPSCLFLQAYCKDPQEDPKSVMAPSGKEAIH